MIGVVLVGGESRRMRRPKALLAHPQGGTLADWAARRLEAVCGRVVLAGTLAGATARPRIDDGPGKGPAAGILGAAREYPDIPLLVLACDLPNVSPALLAALARSPAEWALPEVAGRLEPLAALYRPPALTALAWQVARGDFALHHLRRLGALRIEIFGAARLARFGEPGELLLNLNTPSELARWREG